jgi:hypothetical protein
LSEELFIPKKLLLAKGYATFRELKPTIEGKIPSSTLKELDDSFHIMLKSLGNPGLFGLLREESDLAKFKEHKNKVLNTLKSKIKLDLGILLTINQKHAFTNGQTSTLDAAPYIRSDRTFVPVRFIVESLGASVKWDATSQTVTITSSNKSIALKIGNKQAFVNGSTRVNLDAPPEIINNRTFIPIRFVSEVLGYQVGWNGTNQTVIIE